MSESSGAEEEYHAICLLEHAGGKSYERKGVNIHQCVWEAHFTAVDDAIADGFDEHEDVMVLRIEDYPLDSGFQSLESIHL